MVEFTADLWAHRDEPGSWHFVTLPLEAAEPCVVTVELADGGA